MTLVSFPSSPAISQHLQTDQKFAHANMFKSNDYYGSKGLTDKLSGVFSNQERYFPEGVRLGVTLAMNDTNSLTGMGFMDNLVIDSVTESLGRLAKVVSNTDMRAA